MGVRLMLPDLRLLRARVLMLGVRPMVLGLGQNPKDEDVWCS